MPGMRRERGAPNSGMRPDRRGRVMLLGAFRWICETLPSFFRQENGQGYSLPVGYWPSCWRYCSMIWLNGVLFGPPRSLSVACLYLLGDTLEIHACLLQDTSMDALCRRPCGGLGVILSSPAPFCLDSCAARMFIRVAGRRGLAAR